MAVGMVPEKRLLASCILNTDDKTPMAAGSGAVKALYDRSSVIRFVRVLISPGIEPVK